MEGGFFIFFKKGPQWEIYKEEGRDACLHNVGYKITRLMIQKSLWELDWRQHTNDGGLRVNYFCHHCAPSQPVSMSQLLCWSDYTHTQHLVEVTVLRALKES